MTEPEFTDLNPPDEPPREATDIVPPESEDNPERDPDTAEELPPQRPPARRTDPSGPAAVE